MLELLNNYSLTEIIIFLVLFSLALKGVVSFWDWGVDRLRKIFNKESKKEKEKELLDNHIKQSSEQVKQILSQQEQIMSEILDMKNVINLLINSDKDDIKSWITQQHHYFCYELKYIDDYSLDCIEKRYSHYRDEGGNSFIEDLMKEIRNLPKVSVIRQENN